MVRDKLLTPITYQELDEEFEEETSEEETSEEETPEEESDE